MTRREKDESAGGARSTAVPKAAASRLSLYLRCLESMEAEGDSTVSSQKLAAGVGATAAQVRKDLGYFGQFGYPGVGYRIGHLVGEIRRILGTDRQWNVCLVGIGNLGSALVEYRGFQKQGFRIAALFDNQADVIGQEFSGGLVVEDSQRLAEVIEARSIELALLAVPAAAAQAVADQLVEAGIRGIFNLAPTKLRLPDDVGYVSIDLSVQLEQLSFLVTRNEE